MKKIIAIILLLSSSLMAINLPSSVDSPTLTVKVGHTEQVLDDIYDLTVINMNIIDDHITENLQRAIRFCGIEKLKVFNIYSLNLEHELKGLEGSVFALNITNHNDSSLDIFSHLVQVIYNTNYDGEFEILMDYSRHANIYERYLKIFNMHNKIDIFKEINDNVICYKIKRVNIDKTIINKIYLEKINDIFIDLFKILIISHRRGKYHKKIMEHKYIRHDRRVNTALFMKEYLYKAWIKVENGQLIRKIGLDDNRGYIYIMDDQGNIIVSNGFTQDDIQEGCTERSPLHHSSFCQKCISSGGEIVFNKDEIIYINDETGHYRVDKYQFLQVIFQLLRQGYNFLDATMMVQGETFQIFSDEKVVRISYHATAAEIPSIIFNSKFIVNAA